jgi:hypothetical protein
MRKAKEILEEIRALPVREQLKIVEEVVHEAAEKAAPTLRGPRPLGMDAGKIKIADDFDAPSPEIEKLFYGE